MSSHSAIIQYVEKFQNLTEEEALEFSAAFKEVKFKKRQLIIQPGFTASHRYFVIKGAFRAYVVTENGQEHTISLAIEDWWITDYNSYIFQQAATLFVIALEDSTVLQLEYSAEQKLKSANKNFETFFRIIAERGLAYHQRRVISNLSQNAEERYQEFLDKYPQLVQRIPQYALASFLGMTTEYVSKLRKRRISRKTS